MEQQTAFELIENYRGYRIEGRQLFWGESVDYEYQIVLKDGYAWGCDNVNEAEKTIDFWKSSPK